MLAMMASSGMLQACLKLEQTGNGMELFFLRLDQVLL
jgi:hypothetical protein